MHRIAVVFAAGLALQAAATPAQAVSAAARFLVAEQVKRVCPRGGTFKPAGIMEQDLTGDGKADLILDLASLICRDNRNGTNDECGAAHCPLLFYVRSGDLLKLSYEVTSIGARIGKGPIPSIELVSFEYTKRSVRWDGAKFR